MKVGIIVISFNHFLFTRMCLESIIKHTDRDKYKLCLVDNGSIDDTKLWAKNLLLDNKLDNFIDNDYNMGACKASNQGVEWVLNEDEITHVLVMANDHIVTPNWLEPLLNSTSDCTNPFVFHSVKDIRKMCSEIDPVINKYKNLRLKYLQRDDLMAMNYVLKQTYSDLDDFSNRFTSKYLDYKPIFTTFILWPGLIMYKKKVIEKVGLKDEEYLKYDLASYSDIDYYLRIYLKEFTSAVVLNSYVHHWGSITTRKMGLKSEEKTGYTNNEYGAFKHFVKKWGCSPHDLSRFIKKRK